MEIASSSSRLQVATMENVSKVQLWMSLNCSFRVLKLGKCIFSCHCWWMREEVEVTDLAKCWKGRELEAPEKLPERANFESPAARPALRNSKPESYHKCIRKCIRKGIRESHLWIPCFAVDPALINQEPEKLRSKIHLKNYQKWQPKIFVQKLPSYCIYLLGKVSSFCRFRPNP